MTIYGIEQTYWYGDFSFQIVYDSGNETGLDQRDIHWQERKSEPRWVRSFYFNDVVEQHMRAFCKRFAEDEPYRQASIARTTDWAIRDRLFRRNAAAEFWQKSLLTEKLGSVPKMYSFFKKHWKNITSSVEYQTLMQIDNAFQPSRGELDPEIQQAVNLFNEIEGVKTKFSCQGVSRTYEYEGFNILADTPHTRLAYISFDSCPTPIAHLLQT